ncbi:MAG: queuosine salvage family protein [Candidatus Shapirobacteria bacterium]|nr:queuosine salvage family protein [Candidatus Shapirobacteria bacterium]
MKIILDSTKPIIEQSKHVRINREAILEFAKTIASGDFEQSEYNNETIIENGSNEEQVAYSIVYNSLNFCYWGQPKWAITIDRKNYDGSFAMLRALKKGLEKGYRLLNPQYLTSLPEEDLKTVFLGNVEIPLFKERLKLLKNLGQIVSQKFDGSFFNIIKKGQLDAVKIVEVLVKDFPKIFNDTANYHGQKVFFHKRAQLVPAHLVDLEKFGLISEKITSYDQLTAFADYKVPQILRKFNILEYDKELTEKVDNMIKIPAGSDEEIEIRANTIWAIELATQKLMEKFPQASAAKVDGIFWFRGQTKSPDDKPYHRTRTIWY